MKLKMTSTCSKPSLCWVVFILLAFVGNLSAIRWHDAGIDTRWAHDCEFIGNDITSQHSPGNRCGPLCVSNPVCNHFTWTNYEGGTCWMKSGKVSESSAMPKTTDGAVCGFLRQRTIVSPTVPDTCEPIIKNGVTCSV